jgi:hypothetical protein
MNAIFIRDRPACVAVHVLRFATNLARSWTCGPRRVLRCRGNTIPDPPGRRSRSSCRLSPRMAIGAKAKAKSSSLQPSEEFLCLLVILFALASTRSSES